MIGIIKKEMEITPVSPDLDFTKQNLIFTVKKWKKLKQTLNKDNKKQCEQVCNRQTGYLKVQKYKNRKIK